MGILGFVVRYRCLVLPMKMARNRQRMPCIFSIGSLLCSIHACEARAIEHDTISVLLRGVGLVDEYVNGSGGADVKHVALSMGRNGAGLVM